MMLILKGEWREEVSKGDPSEHPQPHRFLPVFHLVVLFHLRRLLHLLSCGRRTRVSLLLIVRSSRCSSQVSLGHD